MKNRRFFKLLYFDGFAGSGEIIKVYDDPMKGTYDVDITIGAAKRIIEIEEPRAFDEYYFVEKKPKNYKQLEVSTKKLFPQKKIFTIRKYFLVFQEMRSKNIFTEGLIHYFLIFRV